jgi:hypothetical protein
MWNPQGFECRDLIPLLRIGFESSEPCGSWCSPLADLASDKAHPRTRAGARRIDMKGDNDRLN